MGAIEAEQLAELHDRAQAALLILAEGLLEGRGEAGGDESGGGPGQAPDLEYIKRGALRWLFHHLIGLVAEARGSGAAAAASGLDRLWQPPALPHPYLERARRGLVAPRGGAAPEEPLDYARLPARALGTLYEGLLGLRLVRGPGGRLELAPHTGRRKAHGAYYTPRYIVDFIVEQTLGPLVEELRKSPDGGEPLWRRLLGLRVLDPAMGSGHFLLGALAYLAREVAMARVAEEGLGGVEEWVAGGSGGEAATLAWARTEVARRSLHGWELDPLAVAVARSSLWLATREGGAGPAADPAGEGEAGVVSPEELHLEEVNALFHGPALLEGLETVEEGSLRFDGLIGNPPYGATFSPVEKERLKRLYQCHRTGDSAELFCELALRLVRPGGCVGLVMPKSLAFYARWAALRAYLLERARPLALLDMGLAFEKVNFETLAVVVRRALGTAPQKEGAEGSQVAIYRAEPLRRVRPVKEVCRVGRAPLRYMALNKVVVFGAITPAEQAVIDRVLEASVPLGRIAAEIFRGLYIPDIEKEALAEGPYPFVEKVPHVGRYQIRKIKQIEIADKVAWSAKARRVMVPRLLLKVLRGSRLVAYAEEQGELLTTEKLVNVTLKPDSGYALAYLAALINSPLPSFVLQRTLFSGTTETSRVMDGAYSGQIPIYAIDFLTPTRRREALLARACQYYAELAPKAGRAEGPAAGAAGERLLGLVDSWLKEEQRDVIHDLLAHLARQMVALNRQWQASLERLKADLENMAGSEVVARLGRLYTPPRGQQREESAGKGEGVGSLSEDTSPLGPALAGRKLELADCHRLDREQLRWCVKQRLGPKFQVEGIVKLLEMEAEAGPEGLGQLSRRLEATDWLIDEVVRRLYGLSEAQWELVQAGSQPYGGLGR